MTNLITQALQNTADQFDIAELVAEYMSLSDTAYRCSNADDRDGFFENNRKAEMLKAVIAIQIAGSSLNTLEHMLDMAYHVDKMHNTSAAGKTPTEGNF